MHPRESAEKGNKNEQFPELGDEINKGRFGGALESLYGMMAWRCGKCNDFMPGTKIKGNQ